MVRRVGAAALVAFVAAVVVSLGVPAGAATSGLTVRLTVDQPIVTIDRDAPHDQTLGYEIVVTNDGGDVAPGVVVESDLPGGAVHRVVGDLAPGDEWREVVTATLAASTRGGPIESVAVARSSDGREVASAPARVDVQVISSAVYDRDEPPATHVLGVTEERPAPSVLPSALPRTGVPVAPLVAVATFLLVLGASLVRIAE